MKKYKESIIKKGITGIVLVESIATIFANMKRRIRLGDEFVNDSERKIVYSKTESDIDEKRILITGANSYDIDLAILQKTVRVNTVQLIMTLVQSEDIIVRERYDEDLIRGQASIRDKE